MIRKKNFSVRALAVEGATARLRQLAAESEYLQEFLRAHANGATPRKTRAHAEPEPTAPPKQKRRKLAAPQPKTAKLQRGSLRTRIEQEVRAMGGEVRPVDIAQRLIAAGYPFRSQPLHAVTSAARHCPNRAIRKTGTARSAPVFYSLRS
jgi:hypothetical protein